MPDDITNMDIKLAYDTIKNKKPLYDELHRYYAGYHPLRYSTKKLKDVFKSINTYFAENWLGVIIDAVIDRLVLNGFDISENDEASKLLNDLWRDYNISLIAEDIHESATIVSEGYIIAMNVENEDGEEELDIYFNDARMCHMFYYKDQPNKKRMAAKVYVGDDNYFCLVLYYADHFEYYRSKLQIKDGQWPASWKSFIPDVDGDWEDNPFDVIPVFHWAPSRTTKKRDLGPSEVSMQDAINKLLSDMMVSSDFNSFVQRIIISQADPGNLPNSPNSNWWIPASDTGQAASVQELGGRDLSGYLEAIDKLATSLAIISRTPKHYFFSQGGDPSGEALIAMEAPLNKKVKKRQGRYSVEWQAFVQFLLQLNGVEISRNQIVTLWEPAETIQPVTTANIIQTLVSTGVPLITALRRQGWTNNDVKQLQDDLLKSPNDKNSIEIKKILWEAARNAVQAGVPLETFLKAQGWTDEELEEMGTQRLAAIVLQQEDTIPENEQ
jgi:hypothetical protein